MSLKVWLPLNGDLENKGISNTVITANGASINTSGKIGKCYSFDGSDDYISLDSSTFYDIIKGGTQPFSIAMWIYHNDSTRAILFGDYGLSGAINFNIELTTAHQVRFYWNGSPDKNFDSNSSVGLQTWTHIILTYDGSQLLLYKNGSIISDKYSGTLATKNKSSGVYYLGRDSRTGTTALNGKLNDFRLYDHALSAKEIKEISQGLVLHYKLDGYNLFNPNTLTQGSYLHSNGNIGTDGYWALTDYIPVNLGTSYIGYNLINGGNGTPSICYYDNTKTYTRGVAIIPNESLSVVPQNNECYVRISIRTYNNDINKILFLEIPNIIQDNSGYNNNGEIYGSLTFSPVTTRYSTSCSFNGTDSSIKVPYNAACPHNNFTCNLWFKKDDWGTKGYETLFGGPSGFEMDTRSGTNQSLQLNMVSTRSGKRNLVTEMSLGNWYMVTMTRSDTVEKYYVNGIYQSEIEAKAMPTGNYFIGSWSSATSQNYYGYISDFRLYDTVFSDEDILDLYHTSMSIDNSKNTHAFEFDEKDQNVIAGIPWTSPFSIHSKTQSIFTNYNSDGEPQFVANNTSAGSDYIEITPGTYYYDTTISVNAGNQFYIGFERYDANKTARENSACAYIYTTKSSSNIVKQRYKGTVNLSTDGVNTIKYISLRILNGWSGTTSGVTGQATVHNLSLRLVSEAQNPRLAKTGQLITSEIKEDAKSSLYKNDIVEAVKFIER